MLASLEHLLTEGAIFSNISRPSPLYWNVNHG
ncbi:hypothetical protein VCG_000066 [Vibrio cholerae 12129(1)]|nr:hypothetical protein VCD_001284 [Vibrio cholerae MJ-1236]EEO01003.1 hypothetical protein VCG_000066 [Vibrio cholerae 12129(1)]EEO01091.1 hypothetical protein VCA_000021 [Vibrio cholerae VL426]EEO11922.1 hypothetical protein VCC_000067 [Vibrio cholerae RC9]EEO15543.1 hypothetical protein VCB_000024 [Vibrio cholerae TMA 21]EEO19234.1 hypothetical protein VCE_000076 [Vibrio cholerae B33]EEO20889.1 hypothetical protein VCF_002089 [Vibrio cholerae BX 330286]CSI84104.1 ribosome-associated GTPas